MHVHGNYVYRGDTCTCKCTCTIYMAPICIEEIHVHVHVLTEYYSIHVLCRWQLYV